jgi:hypothetical protein
LRKRQRRSPAASAEDLLEGFAELTEDFRIICDACRAAQALNDQVLSSEKHQKKEWRLTAILDLGRKFRSAIN